MCFQKLRRLFRSWSDTKEVRLLIEPISSNHGQKILVMYGWNQVFDRLTWMLTLLQSTQPPKFERQIKERGTIREDALAMTDLRSLQNLETFTDNFILVYFNAVRRCTRKILGTLFQSRRLRCFWRFLGLNNIPCLCSPEFCIAVGQLTR